MLIIFLDLLYVILNIVFVVENTFPYAMYVMVEFARIVPLFVCCECVNILNLAGYNFTKYIMYCNNSLTKKVLV